MANDAGHRARTAKIHGGFSENSQNWGSRGEASRLTTRRPPSIGEAAVDELAGDVLGGRGADDRTPLDAVEDGLAPGQRPQVLRPVRKFVEDRLRYVSGSERPAHDVADDAARFTQWAPGATEPSGPGSGTRVYATRTAPTSPTSTRSSPWRTRSPPSTRTSTCSSTTRAWRRPSGTPSPRTATRSPARSTSSPTTS